MNSLAVDSSSAWGGWGDIAVLLGGLALLAVVVLGASRILQARAAAGREERYQKIAEEAAAAQNAAASQLADLNARLSRVEKILSQVE
ncbi:hypothetical protein HZZ00_19045 [Streptomyces sp. NEAU-sy36]|uniref:hypothetical protein n=1 Tax=unclassified Streptomyces TaxID=2593676 RepID=UPI0015D588E4|nr:MULTISPECIES: hypothetical protein [unclassified Streptomyces]QLJ02898.1 hypothetical protein HZZ00_19045 [Streptomyces sp. NEAU-sy36]